MNLNYEGSVAERFFKFRSTVAQTELVAGTNIFNAISIYVPSSLASANINGYSAVEEGGHAVITVTNDNYKDVFKADSALFSQWSAAFNDGANIDMIIYLVVFDDEDFSPTVTATGISWAPLSDAFNELYYISCFKTMFSEHYDGTTVSGEASGNYDDSNYFDMVLCLSSLCEAETQFSVALIEAKVEVYTSTDSNPCKVMSQTRAAETTHCTTFTSTTKSDRAQYCWGYLNFLGGKHSNFIINNGKFMLPYILGKWFTAKNDSGEYLGNKLAKIRLSGNGIKPTGLPSPLNADVNQNLPRAIYTVLDEKNVGYFLSIADGSLNDVELITDRTIANYPITAYAIAKYIDYNASQAMANFLTDTDTLTNPVLCNEETYNKIKNILLGMIQKFIGTKRISNIVTKFPPFSEAKKGNKLVGTAVWSADYTDDLGGVEMSGQIGF